MKEKERELRERREEKERELRENELGLKRVVAENENKESPAYKLKFWDDAFCRTEFTDFEFLTASTGHVRVFAIANPCVVCLSIVCNVGAPYSWG